VPGIDFTNDPLLQGRIHSYLDTQLSAWAARTSTRSRSTRRSRRCTTTSATACTARRSIGAASRLRAQLAGGGCPFQAGTTDLYTQLAEAGALPRYIGRRLGTVGDGDQALPVEVTFEAAPSVLWDAAVLPAGMTAAEILASDDHVIEFVTQQWRHNKALLVPQSALTILTAAGIDVDVESDVQDDADSSFRYEVAPGLLLVPDESVADAMQGFMQCVAMHRTYERFNGNAMEPPAMDVMMDEEAETPA
jgi:catalase